MGLELRQRVPSVLCCCQAAAAAEQQVACRLQAACLAVCLGALVQVVCSSVFGKLTFTSKHLPLQAGSASRCACRHKVRIGVGVGGQLALLLL